MRSLNSICRDLTISFDTVYILDLGQVDEDYIPVLYQATPERIEFECDLNDFRVCCNEYPCACGDLVRANYFKSDIEFNRLRGSGTRFIWTDSRTIARKFHSLLVKAWRERC